MDYHILMEKIRREGKFYIYGAGIVACGALIALRRLCPSECKAFWVTDAATNPDEIAGIPVKAIEKRKTAADPFILIAVPEHYHQEIKGLLELLGYHHYAFLDSHLEYCLMGEYLEKTICLKRIEAVPSLAQLEPDSIRDAYIAMAVSHKDRPLQNSCPQADWIHSVQAGAALTSQRTGEARDDVGDNISGRNPLYGELTAAYWMWKNAPHAIMGLFHYRRTLKVTDRQLSLLQTNEADVILPLPYVCWPNTSWQYGRYLAKEDQDILWQVLEENSAEFCDRARQVLKNQYLYNYNILIAKKEVYTDYCTWLFSLLFKIENKCRQIEIKRNPRYLGQIGEILSAIYFLVNDKRWRIIHAEMERRI